MVCEDEQTAQILKELMAGFFVHAKVILRKQRYIVYLKDSEEIIQILNVMEAHRSLMELENIRSKATTEEKIVSDPETPTNTGSMTITF